MKNAGSLLKDPAFFAETEIADAAAADLGGKGVQT